MLMVETELESPVAALFLLALEREAQVDGFSPHFHFRDSAGRNVREFRRADELLILKSQELHGHLRIDVESETFDVGPLIERATARAAADMLSALIDGLGEVLSDRTRAKLRHEIDRLLAQQA